MLYQLTYISSVNPRETVEVDDILATSRRENARVGVTGLLIHDGKRFLQAIEGEATALMTTFARIKVDPRHRALVILSQRETSERQFGSWSMASNAVATTRGSRAHVDAVDMLTAEVPDPNVQALFRSFARIERAA